MEETTEPVSFYQAVGGEQTFFRLVHSFYRRVAADPALRAVYPSRDLGPAEEHLRLFLIQYWGGPRTYDERRGHPRLRMRHAHFSIGEAERDAWLRPMRAALDEIGLDEPTNDLDVETLASLENALLDFPGCAVITSHDRWFLDRVATHILAWEGGANWFWFEGNFEAYEKNKIERLGAEAARPHRVTYRRLTRG